jgi:hypothetical protein
MTKEDNSKRAFFKKAMAAVGFLAAANYAKNLILAHADPIVEVNDNSANDVNLQRRTLLNKQIVLMTDSEKTKMLDEILDLYEKNRT